MESLEVRREAQRREAARRVEARTSERQGKRAALARGDLTAADSPERVAKRLDRLSRYYAGEELPTAPTPVPADTERLTLSALRRASHLGLAPEPEAADPARAGVVLEKIINTEDFVDIRYLEAGVAAARAVGRVLIRTDGGRLSGYGSGSMVSPRLFLTNHHVLPSSAVAAASAVEFNYQDGLDGQPLQPKEVAFDPETFFLADEERDFALVALTTAGQLVAELGFNRLIPVEGKAVVGECVTIVQHPRGEKKQVALRENRILDVVESFLHYEADTEPGSSGSPVFNDQWEVVALHHASVPARQPADERMFMNEGIRVSRIIAFVRSQSLPPTMAALADELLAAERVLVNTAVARPGGVGHPAPAPVSTGRPPATPAVLPPREQLPEQAPTPTISFSVPLEISVHLGAAVASTSSANGNGVTRRAAEPSTNGARTEAIEIDPDYSTRRGYDPEFLGARHPVPVPSLGDPLVPKASINRAAPGELQHVFPYHHFSVAMNKERRLAFFTAVNIDGSLSRRLKRERDRWILDPRLPAAEQTGEVVYLDNDLDRGHLVRRLDPAWATSDASAKLANDDTFHFTNCTPQHKDFNQNQTTWAGLEDYVLENADNRDLRVSVFTGPVFADDDDEYRGVKLPRQFWKVVAMVKQAGSLSATGYLLSQEALLRGLETAEEFSYGAYRTFQVPIADIESLTGLSFGSLADADPLGGLEAMVSSREIRSPEDLVL